MSGLAELVEELAVGRVQWVSETRMFSEPLLYELRQAVFGDIGSTRQGSSSSSPIPIDAGAFSLWEDITGQIAAQFEGATDLPSHQNSPATSLLAWWAAFSAAVYRTDHLNSDEVPLLAREIASERLEGWAQRIRDYFLPPKTVEVMVACPNCGYERVTLGSGDQAEEVFALSAEVRNGSVTITCRNPVCRDAFGERSEWSGDQPIAELGRRTGHWIKPADIAAALAPVAEVEWAEEPEPVEEPFDPTKREHVLMLNRVERADQKLYCGICDRWYPSTSAKKASVTALWAELIEHVDQVHPDTPEDDPVEDAAKLNEVE